MLVIVQTVVGSVTLLAAVAIVVLLLTGKYNAGHRVLPTPTDPVSLDPVAPGPTSWDGTWSMQHLYTNGSSSTITGSIRGSVCVTNGTYTLAMTGFANSKEVKIVGDEVLLLSETSRAQYGVKTVTHKLLAWDSATSTAYFRPVVSYVGPATWTRTSATCGG